MIHPRFRLIAAPFTPMTLEGDLHLAVVPEQARRLVATGVQGVFVGGTTGEGQSLTVDERLALAEAWAADPHRSQLELFIHVGHNSIRDAARLAAQARSLGADAIALHAATWFRYQSLGDLIEFCVPVAAAAAPLPFYFYDIPSITGVHLSAAAFLAEAKGRIPTLAGIKYTNPDCITLQECVQLDAGEYDILWGTDEALLAGVALGASGAVGSTYNFAAPLYLRLLEALRRGDWASARREQAAAIAMVRIFQRWPTLAALKFAMSLLGIDCGPVRPPLTNLSADDKARLRSELEKIDFSSRIVQADTPPKADLAAAK